MCFALSLSAISGRLYVAPAAGLSFLARSSCAGTHNKMLDSYLIVTPTKDHLVMARMATLMHEARSNNAIALRDEVLPLLYKYKAEAEQAEGKRTRKPQPKELLVHEQTLDAILADLILASRHVEALGLCFRSSNRQEFTRSGTKASSRAYEWQIPALEAAKLIERRAGFSANKDFDGSSYVAYRRATRLRATPALLALAARHGIDPDALHNHYDKLKSTMPASPIVLRAENRGRMRGGILPCPNTPKATKIRRQVEQINAIYARHSFEGMPRPHVSRLFNCADADGFDFNKGGRLNSDFQSMSRESRRKILIDGHPVVELDLKASHLTILYAITQTPMPEGDPYHINDLPRAVVKAIVTAMIGLGHTNLARWPRESRSRLLADLGDSEPMSEKVFTKLYPIKATAAKVLMRHPVLHHLSPGVIDWADLQFIESEILISAVLQLGFECGIPALPIHDSIIVPKKDKEIGRMCLSGAFNRMVRRNPQIETKD